MHTHVTSEEAKRLGRQTQRSTRSNLHFHRGEVKDYVDYVVDHSSSRSIAVVGKIHEYNSERKPVLTYASLCRC
jgi:hypothetical protein